MRIQRIIKPVLITLVITIILMGAFSEITNTGRAMQDDNSDFGMIDAFIKDEDLKLKIEFIGYDEDLINETALEAELKEDFSYYSLTPHSNFHFNFEFSFLEQTPTDDLEAFILANNISGTDTGYKVNTTLLEEDLASGNRSDIFLPRDGMSINATQIEDYIFENLYTEPVNDPGYTMYILNFSQFDNLDHSFEHWYDTTGLSMDANESISWWYSGYGDLAKRSAMGWGGNYRFCYLDLSARSWFFDYITTAWQSLGLGYELYYDYPDLDNLTQMFDMTTQNGKNKLNEYIGGWINTYLGNVFSGPVSDPPIGQSISLQVKVFNNLTLNGYAEEDLKWCISKNRILNQLELDFPWIKWMINIEWIELTDDPQLYGYIQDNIQIGLADEKYIEVSNGLFSLLQGELNDHFNLSQADTVLPCYFFLTNDVHFKWYGTSFAGLGGMGWEILLGSQYSLFEDGLVTEPRRGMSSVMIHELGHSLGLPHPHSNSYGWGSAFVADVMSYFAYDEGFSTFYQDAIGRAHSDGYYMTAQMEYAQAISDYTDAGSPEALNATFAEVSELLNMIPQYYLQMDYNSSASLGIQARNLLEYIDNYLQNPPISTKTSNSNIDFSVFIIIPTVLSPVLAIIRKRKIND